MTNIAVEARVDCKSFTGTLCRYRFLLKKKNPTICKCPCHRGWRVMVKRDKNSFYTAFFERWEKRKGVNQLSSVGQNGAEVGGSLRNSSGW